MQQGLTGFGWISCVVVTYNPDDGFIDHFNAILPQVDELIIVDNKSSEGVLERIGEFVNQNSKAHLIANKKNVGLAAAQNLGISGASPEAAWIMLMDDDSLPDINMVSSMKSAYLNLSRSSQEGVAIVSPRVRDVNIDLDLLHIVKYKKVLFKRRGFEENPILSVLFAIASGCLIKKSVIEKLGDMLEEFFIDYVDTEFCLRAVSSGYEIIAVRDAVINHRLGAKSTHRILGKQIIAPNHSAERKYTIYRNRVIVWKEYLAKVPSYVIYDMLAAVYDTTRIALIEGNKINKLKNIVKGIYHGVSGKKRQ